MGELKDCPFCGRGAWVVRVPDTRRFRPQCKKCGADLGEFDREADAVAAWNRRTASPAEGRMGEDFADWFNDWAKQREMVMIRMEDGRFLSPDTSLAEKAYEAGCMTTAMFYMELCRQEEQSKTSPADSPATLGEGVADEHAVFVEHCADKLEKHGYPSTARALRETAGFLRALAKKPEGRAVDDWPKTIVVSSGDMCFTADWDGEYFVTRSPIKLDDSATPPEVGGGRGK